MNKYGFVRIAVCSPIVSVGNPDKNVSRIAWYIESLTDADIVVFPELCLTGYTCGDLFRQQQLLSSTYKAIETLCSLTCNTQKLVFVGAPIGVGNQTFNCAVAIRNGEVIGVVPKTNIPNYAEFYESRWFRAAEDAEAKEISLFSYINKPVPFGTDLLFEIEEGLVAAEICEDLWMPIPPSSYAAIAGATILVNLSASNETVGKNTYRTELVKNQSGRCVAAYAYASAGPSESTTDVVFGGHCIIAENGQILNESRRVGQESKQLTLGDWYIEADVDVQKVQTERRLLSSFGDAKRSLKKDYRVVSLNVKHSMFEVDKELKRFVSGTPFIPADHDSMDARCAEIIGIQCAGLWKRLQQLNFGDVVIGVSGGLDSTLALLVAAKTYRQVGADIQKIHGITMPGFGTTQQTKTNAVKLMDQLGISQETIDIREICLATFKALKHKPFGIEIEGMDVSAFEEALKAVPKEKRHDLVFENVQARERTKILMSRGFVLGTGDLSELALGWCTYNGDHMSMYNVNASIPKTLVRFLVGYLADKECNNGHPHEDSLDYKAWTEYQATGKTEMNVLFDVLHDIIGTTVSPELLPPGADGEIEQSTEDVLGPYELHDFYLSNFIRSGFSPEKILYLSDHAKFSQPYSRELRIKTLITFLRRFFSQQFKRSCVPDGPKVGSVSLSPRGDWRMPSDADVSIWIAELESGCYGSGK